MFSKNLAVIGLLSATSMIGATAQAAVVYNDNNGNKMEVGGRIQANLNSVSASENDKVGIKGKARLRIKGDSKIADGFVATAMGEWDVSGETSQDGTFKSRYVYLGVKTDDFGTLLLGQQHTAMYQVMGRTDVFIDWGKEGNTYWTLGGRQEGQAYYQYKKNGFVGSASYQSAGLDRVDNGFAAALGYTFDAKLPISIDLGVDHYALAEGKTDKTKYLGNNEDRTSYAAALSAGTVGDGLYLAGMYQLTDFDKAKNRKGFEVLGGYGFENGVGLLLCYQNLSQDGDTLVSSIVSEVSYNLSSNFKTYIEGEIGVGDIDVDTKGNKVADPESSDNKLSLGLQYNF